MLENNTQNKAPEPQVTTLQREAVGSKGSVVPYILGAAVISFVGLVIVAFRYGSLNNSIEQAQMKLTEVQSQYAQVQDYGERVNKLATVLAAFDEASAKQIAYNDVLTLLQNSTYKQAKIESLNIKDNGNVSISGSTSSYNDFAKLIKSIRGGRDNNPQGLTSSVTFGSVSQDFVKQLSDNVEVQVPATTFSISFNLKSDLFLDPTSFIRSAIKTDQPPLDVNLTPVPSDQPVSDQPVSDQPTTEPQTDTNQPNDVLDAFSDSLSNPPSSSNL